MRLLQQNTDTFLTVLICLTWVAAFVTGVYLNSELILVVLTVAVPAILLILYYFFRPDLFLFLLVFFIPLSVKTGLPGGSTIAMPAELMAVLMFIYCLLNFRKIISERKEIYSHPLFLLLIVYILWLLIASALSDNPFISLKRTFIQIIYFTVFFVLFVPKFNKIRNILKFFLFYSLGLIIPVINGFIWHSQYNFNPQASYYMPQPFFTEHTVYGAALAFVIPVLVYMAFFRNPFNRNPRYKSALIVLAVIIILAEFLAFSRAAWVSLIVLPLVQLALFLKIRKALLFTSLLVMVILIYLYPNEILSVIGKTDARSNRGNISEQIESISNIKTDISNVERLNRWKSAIRMFEDKPLTGHGPGMYQFVYYRYQLKKEMTRISTYHGEKGNSHSEYLGFLSETGFPGLLIYLSIVFGSISIAIKIIYRSRRPQIRTLTTVVLFSLLTFYFHTIFNGFLDSEKLGCLVFGALAAITALDIYFFRQVR